MSAEAGRLMDAIYTRQRHIYDLTRKFYLLGRDELIADLAVPAGGSVLEIACGTGRNLIAVARRHPEARCYGLDVSRAMLDTASRAVDRAGFGARIRLAEADATSFDPAALFGTPRFDRVFISYALSMIPPWQAALRHGAGLLAPGGSLHLVDFGDGHGLPRPAYGTLLAWLSRFHVSPRRDLPDAVAAVAREVGLIGTTRPLFRGYALAATLALPPSSSQ